MYQNCYAVHTFSELVSFCQCSFDAEHIHYSFILTLLFTTLLSLLCYPGVKGDCEKNAFMLMCY